METTVFLFLMLQKYINSKQKTQIQNSLCLGNISKDFMISNMNKIVLKGIVKLFLLTLFLLILAIL